MTWVGVVIIYLLLFALTSHIAHKKAGTWSKDDHEGISGILMKSFILWVYLAGFVGIFIGCLAILEAPAFYIALGNKIEAFTASLISALFFPSQPF